jgi:hypothetical protein
MILRFLMVSILVVVFSCKKAAQNNTQDADAADKSQTITEKDISKFKYLDFTIDEKAQPLIEPWQPYKQLEDIMVNVKKGDLSYFKADAKKNLKTLLTDMREHIPDTLNTPSILARIAVVETTLYKTESLSNLSTTKKETLANTLKELLVSFSNLNFQINKKLEKDSQVIEKPM